MLKCWLIPLLLILPAQFYSAYLRVKFFPQNATAYLIDAQNHSNRLQSFKYVNVEIGNRYTVSISAEGYYSKSFPVTVNQKYITIEDKLEKKYSVLQLVAELPTSGHPKSILFLDNDRLIVNSFSGMGFDLFSLSQRKLVKVYDDFSSKWCPYSGFVEALVDRQQNELYITQLYAYRWHIFDLATLKYKKTLPTYGNWTKVIAESDKYLFMSNWLGKDISVFDRFSKKFIKRIKVAEIPRGMAVTPDGKYLYVAIFSLPMIQKIDLDKLKVVKTITLSSGKGNARHLVIDKNKNLMYISDMGKGMIYQYDLIKDKILSTVNVYTKPNTITLSQDGSTLFCATRGPNGPNGYTNKGPEFGRLYVIDTDSMRIDGWIWGRNQPTGLDISPDGKYLVFGDFLDDNIEIYRFYPAYMKKEE